MDESIEEINECQGDGCAPEICARLYKQSTFTNANYVCFFLCLFSLCVAAQSTMLLFIFLMVFLLLTLAVLFISHQQFS